MNSEIKRYLVRKIVAAVRAWVRDLIPRLGRSLTHLLATCNNATREEAIAQLHPHERDLLKAVLKAGSLVSSKTTCPPKKKEWKRKIALETGVDYCAAHASFRLLGGWSDAGGSMDDLGLSHEVRELLRENPPDFAAVRDSEIEKPVPPTQTELLVRQQNRAQRLRHDLESSAPELVSEMDNIIRGLESRIRKRRDHGVEDSFGGRQS